MKKYTLLNFNKYMFYLKNFFFIKKKHFLNKNKKYIVYEGPPSMNGKPGIHHLLSKIIKDVAVRYKIMKKYYIKRIFGWDTHGLPIELKVEKKLNINKFDIDKNKISIKKFNNLCKNLVNKNIKIWRNLTYKLGSFNINNKIEYCTYKDNYIETVWYIFNILYKKNIIYKSYKVQPYSPLAGTVISNNELNFPNTYKKIVDVSVYLLFKLDLIKNKNLNLLVWTTTPWTISSNSALAINKKYYYYIIKTNNYYYNTIIYIIIGKNCINNIFTNQFKIINNKLLYIYKILYKIKGKNLLKYKYFQLIKWIKPCKHKNKYFRIYNANYVSYKEGTGIVHIAPNFGMEDFLLSKKKNIPYIYYIYKNKKKILVNSKGKYEKFLPKKYKNRYIYKDYYSNSKKYNSLNKDIIKYLIKKKKVFKIKKINHKYPHCWRTGGRIIFYPIKSWFLKLNKKILIKYINKIKWINNVGKKKFFFWIKNSVDWNISRSRFWGIPLPIWKSLDNKIILVIKSKKKLLKYIVKYTKLNFKNILNKKNILHRENLDDIVFLYKKKKLYREKLVFDVWFDSGCMPFGQFSYPFNNKDYINKKKYYPSNFICEGIDQIRGWFFSIYVISILFKQNIAYKKVLVTGLILDKYGKKMSKSKNNTLDPFILLNKYGLDLIRFFFLFYNKPYYNIKFDEMKILNIKKKFFNTLINVYNFFSMYCNLDKIKIKTINFKYLKYLDKWILSVLNNLIYKVNYYYKKYNYYQVTNLLYNFLILDLSNWYIRLSRNRFWKSKINIYKINVYNILYICICIFLKLSYPIIPCISEYIFKKINCNIKQLIYKNLQFPKYKKKLIKFNLEKTIYILKTICSLILSIRKKYNIKVRIPLNNVKILLKEKNNFFSFCKEKNIITYIKKEVNIENIFFLKNDNNIFNKKIVIPVYKILGPKYKNKLKLIVNIINKLNYKQINEIEKKKKIQILINNKKHYLYNKELKFKLLNNNKNINIFKEIKIYNILIYLNIDLNLNSKLLKKGFIRDLINKIQKKRKKENILINKKINIKIFCNKYIKNIIKYYYKIIIKETLIKKIYFINKKKKIKLYIL
ncbi:MAG: isoleucine--tRNA ligase [Candidatus Shikimatogenerans sp. AspAUS03]|uniref:Isoleucine--tRNA ligase n=1 Tax=Candidatus Shikimatogenerans sp. AspAUS03 TaxID=3158563 RepID=A0AAU7QSX7_9FLAO